jgi:hypothetical protein
MRFAVFAVFALLCSCQPLPHPFDRDVPSASSGVLTPPDSAGVVVEPIAGAPEPTAHDLAAAMAAALQEDDVPASTGASNRGSYRLSGKATIKDVGGGNLLVKIAWEMRDANGVPASRQDTTLSMPLAVWQRGGKDLTEFTHEAAPFLARMVESTAPPPRLDVDPLIAVRVVTGAPGDGDQSLGHAMEDALRRSNLNLVQKPDDKPRFLVQGSVDVTPPENGKQQVTISWSVLHPDGSSIGQVKQENAVPAGSLDGAWGLTAYDVANAAAPGIAALIAELQRADARS